MPSLGFIMLMVFNLCLVNEKSASLYPRLYLIFFCFVKIINYFINYSLKNYRFSDIYNTKFTKSNINSHFLHSTFSYVADCVPAHFMELNYFADTKKTYHVEHLFDELFSLKNVRLLPPSGEGRMFKKKIDCVP